MKGFNRLEVLGTEKVYHQHMRLSSLPLEPQTYMCQELLGQRLPLLALPIPIKCHQSPTSLQTISSHFQLVHRMNVLYMTFNTWTVG